MPRPSGAARETVAEREKWDAWNGNRGLGRTDAKRCYIECLIGTMHRYATTTTEARELVAELEFVWDQIKSQSASSSGSSPGLGAGYGGHRRRRGGDDGHDDNNDHNTNNKNSINSKNNINDDDDGGGARGGLRVLRPMSDGDEEDVEDGDLDEDLRDSRPDAYAGDAEGAVAALPGGATRASDMDVRNRKWRKRMEQALVKLSVEVAALREQIERRSIGDGRRANGAWAWARWLAAVFLRHLLVDGAVLALVVLWARRKGDRRLEQGLRLFCVWVKEQMGRVRVPEMLRRAARVT